MKIIHHTDIDGKCAGAIVKTKYPQGILIPYDYGRFPFDQIRQHEEIVIVDCSLRPNDMLMLIYASNPGTPVEIKNITWIDHHATAIDKYKNFQFDIPGKREVGVSGCKLTWNYFYTQCPPYAVEFINDYDLWKFNIPISKTFVTGLKYHDTSPDNSQLWSPLFDDNDAILNDIIQKGKIISKVEENRWRGYSSAYGFPVYWKEYKCFCLNSGGANMDAFGNLAQTYDILIAFVYQHPEYRVTLFTTSTKIDVSKIATEYGGGGHKQAAGFRCSQLPFLEDKA